MHVTRLNGVAINVLDPGDPGYGSTKKPGYNGKVTELRVSEKGALSIYGLQRFPVTLYREQWEAILGHADEIRAFLAANAASLASK